PRRQSEHFADYRSALDTLIDEALVYPAFLSRGQIRDVISQAEASGVHWPHDPDGVPQYPDTDRKRSARARRRMIASGEPYAWRLDVAAALERTGDALCWDETGAGPEGQNERVRADAAAWGD